MRTKKQIKELENRLQAIQDDFIHLSDYVHSLDEEFINHRIDHELRPDWEIKLNQIITMIKKRIK